MRFIFRLTGLLVILAALLSVQPAGAYQPYIVIGSVANGGSLSDGNSGNPVLSANGRFMAFSSYATNLVSGDTNQASDAFVRDLVNGTTEHVSIASDGTQGDGGYYGTGAKEVAISADGRYVAFDSNQANLVSYDTNGKEDVFVHDRQTGQTVRVSIASDGTQGNDFSADPSISADGRYVAFASLANNLVAGVPHVASKWDIYVYDMQTGQTTLVSRGYDGSASNDTSGQSPAISANGQYVVFDSWASNLVSGDTNGVSDIFVRNLQTNQTIRVSVTSGGVALYSIGASAISADGRYTAFSSPFALVSGDTNSAADIFVHDMQTGQTVRASVASDGTQGNSSSSSPSISADGRYVGFYSAASNLVSGDTNGQNDSFVHDMQTGQTSRVSVASGGTGADNYAYTAWLSADGKFAAFRSGADNLVSSDINNVEDDFVARVTFQTDPITNAPTLVSPADNAVNPSLDLSWNSLSGALYYEVQVDGDSAFGSPDQDWTGSGTVYTAAQPTDGRWYWRVRGFNGLDLPGPWSSAWSFTLDSTPPDVPTLVSPADTSFNVLPYLTWDSANLAANYEIQIDDDPAFGSPNQDATTSGLTYDASSLADGTWYWRVRGISGLNVLGTWSSVWSFTLDSTPPDAPTLVTPSNATLNPALNFAWSGVNLAANYEIQIDGDSAFGSPDQDVAANALSFNASPLADGIYYWRVRGISGLNVSGAWSSSWQFTLDNAPPATPTLVSPADTAFNAPPNLTWNSAANAVSYQVQVDDDPAFGSPAQDATTNGLSYDASALAGGAWYWRVRGMDSLNVSGGWSSVWSFTLDSTPPDAPTLFSPANNALNVPLSFTWGGVTNAVSYEIQIDGDPAFASPDQDVTAGALSYNASSLADGLWYWRVRGISGLSISGGWSSVWSLTLNSTPPPAPTLVSPANNVITNTLTFAWGSATNAATYEVQIDNDPAFGSPAQDATVSPSPYNAAPLADGVWYWRVRGINGLNVPGAWSAGWRFTRDGTPPPTPALISPANGATTTNRKPVFSWTNTATAARYELTLVAVGGSAPLIVLVNRPSIGSPSYIPPSNLLIATYQWSVRARDAYGNYSPPSATYSVTIAVASTTQPGVNMFTTNTPTLTWTAVPGATGYEIQVDNNATFASPEYDNNAVAGQTQTLPALPEGTWYWRVRARLSSGAWGAWSPAGVFVIDTS